MRPFDMSSVRATVFRSMIRTVAGAYGDFTFTDVTFAYGGEFFGSRFQGIADIEAERASFERRQRNREWDRRT